ncbi:hypothetical protein TO73_0829 [Thermus aquaticus Y51MC23]|jgi:hypothetical protein|uniref:Uncharacterized protein n=1 Tax=Thermus aquaticus (strain ATCC BAA-2747 / Y51MC23) TaxID=498848 RepID=A0ABN4IGR3_THEA5|nr:hypothetical protein TO73_0829 [Thermus aquaticus Y51MC23]
MGEGERGLEGKEASLGVPLKGMESLRLSVSLLLAYRPNPTPRYAIP